MKTREVEISTNLWITSTRDGKLTINCFLRSSINSEIRIPWWKPFMLV